ncbi:speckle-type POZ protein-like [Leptopilina boulardi]|uniref:speckle-type POZ protein-like n=1 Tax=Leptopilina boulardi TaxID=63433 RepID=UPI0021F5355C|nr:speckle-type POZ protein-like [Leptopilina boulardi]
MDPNVQDLLNSTDLLNFNWIIEKFNEHEVYSSKSFNIAGIPNVKWFIEISPQYEHPNERHEPLLQYNEIRIYNRISHNYFLKNPVKIKLELGKFPNTKIILITTKNISDFKKIVPCDNLQKLTYKHFSSDLYINLRVTPLRSEQKINNIVPPSTNYNNFKPFLMSDHLSDVTFKIDNKEFPAHKIMLASASPVFEKMFSHQMKENITNTVELNDTDPDAFKEMLNFIYTGNVDNLDNVAFGLYILANKYDISKLKIICEQYLEKCLAVYNVISIFELSDRYNSLHLKQKCIEYIDKNFTKVKETKEFNDLNKELSMELLCAIITKAKLTEVS